MRGGLVCKKKDSTTALVLSWYPVFANSNLILGKLKLLTLPVVKYILETHFGSQGVRDSFYKSPHSWLSLQRPQSQLCQSRRTYSSMHLYVCMYIYIYLYIVFLFQYFFKKDTERTFCFVFVSRFFSQDIVTRDHPDGCIQPKLCLSAGLTCALSSQPRRAKN